MSNHELSTDDLLALVHRASTFDERFKDRHAISNDDISRELAESRLNVWSDLVAKGDRDLFGRRLAWDSLDIPTIHPILGAKPIGADAASSAHTTIPHWGHLFQK